MFQTIETFDTEFSADSLEWCPAENFENVFVCGTYQLQNNESKDNSVSKNEGKKRIGRIYLFKVVKHEKTELELLQKLDVVAVLDMKWAHSKSSHGKIFLGVVNAEGFLQIYELMSGEGKVSLRFTTEILTNDEANFLALSLDWSTGLRISSDLKISVSDSKGSISLFKINDSSGEIEKINMWKNVHNFEAWITAFDYWDTNTIFSGGDDCKFLRFDTRIKSDSPSCINSSHNAGVTSLHSNWKKEFHLVSGSYDEILRVWDLRKLKRPLGELNLQGGIWRLKWEPYNAKYLLAACMYNGFFIVNCENFEAPQILAEYKEHESIAYGCDWSFINKKLGIKPELLVDEKDAFVGTCSFYDHTMKLSTFKFDE